MKKILLLAISSLSVCTGFSQIIIEVADFPQAGDSIYQGTDTLVPLSITPGYAGADQTWINYVAEFGHHHQVIQRHSLCLCLFRA